MSDAQLAKLIREANAGDIRAVGQVWRVYATEREDKAKTNYWAERAIDVGDPAAMDEMASDWMWAGQQSGNPAHKRKYYTAAIRLLENGWRNRAMLGRNLGLDFRYMYVNSLREARAALAVLNNGVAPYQKRADASDADAAYHVAVHHFWVQLNQAKRKVAERRASELGDPEFAGWGIHVTTDVIALRDIRRAQANGALIARLGDAWTQAVIRDELADRVKTISDRPSMRRKG
jgi:hypothetical protein